MNIDKNSFDFRQLGLAIKNARTARNITREDLAAHFDMDDRYLARIENEGLHPGFLLFYKLVTMFNISIDPFFFPERLNTKSTRQRQIEKMLDGLDDADLFIVGGTVEAIAKARAMRNADALAQVLSLSYTEIT